MVLRTRRKILGITLIAAILLALAISLCMPREFAAEARIEVRPDNPAAIDVSNDPIPPSEDYAVTLATQASVLESDSLALQVIQQLDLERVARQRARFAWLLPVENDTLPLDQSAARRESLLRSFHKHLSVRAVGGTRLLTVRYLDRDPTLAAAVVNALVNDYLEQYFQTRYNATRQASDWLSGKLAELKTDVTISQQRLAEYQKRTGILGESETSNVIMAKLEEVNRQLTAAEANRVVKQAVWELAKTGDPELISSAAGASFLQGVSSGPNGSQLSLLPSLRSQEAQLKAEIAQTSARVGPAFPKLQQMKAQLADLQISIDSEVGKLAARAENDFIAAQRAETMERALFDKQKEEANRLNDSAVQYGILKREFDTSRDVYEGLLAKLKQAGVLAGLKSSNLVVIDPARPTGRPASPNYLLNLLLGFAGGVTTGVALALIRDHLDRTLHTPADIRQHTKCAVLGIIPQAALPLDSIEVEEAFRNLRTALFQRSQLFPSTVVITSGLPGEGKTTVSVKLARLLETQGRSVLLVDADLRRPSAHAALGLKTNVAGLGDLPETADVTVHALSTRLHFLPAGQRLRDPATLFAAPRFRELVAEWRKSFDCVIFDTSPILSVSDALLLADLSDALLLVVRAEQTTNESLLRCCELLEHYKTSVSIVLNGVNCHSAAYEQYSGHPYSAREMEFYVKA